MTHSTQQWGIDCKRDLVVSQELELELELNYVKHEVTSSLNFSFWSKQPK